MTEVAEQRIRDGRRTVLEAADVVNEVFAAVIGDPPADVPDWRAFLEASTARLCVAHLEQGVAAIPVAEVDDAMMAVARSVEDAAMTALRRVAACEARKRLLRVMGYMTERQREITRLRLFESRSVGEIAAIMNTSSSNISQIVIRCMVKVQPVLTRFDTFDHRDFERVRPPRRLQ
jgi:RNA polymerase sigma factor (sigma-70 family)